MAHLNKIDINGRTYYLQHLTDGKYEAKLPTLKSDTELLLRNQVVNSVTSKDSQNGSSVPLSAAQGYSLNTKLNQEILDREADVDVEEMRAMAAEKVLTDNLAQEVTDRANAVATEQNRATAKENEISANLTTEINRAKAAEEANATAIAKKVDKVDGKGLSDQNYTLNEKTKLEGIETGANKYIHPSHNVCTSGLYKITVDEFGHVSSVVAVSKDDIVGLGMPAKDTTYSDATTNASGLLSAADKTKYDAYDTTITSLLKRIEDLEKLVGEYHPITEPGETE